MQKIVVIAEKFSVKKKFQEALPDVDVTNTVGHIDDLVDLDKIIKKKFNIDAKKPFYWEDSLKYLPLIPPKIDYVLKKGSKGVFDEILKACKGADEIVLGCDPDREGEAIHRNILILLSKKISLNNVKITRLWLNAETKSEIQRAFKERRGYKNYDNFYQAAKIRNIIDWVIGLQLTRLFSVKFSIPGKPLSIGRIQTWLLSEITKRYLINKNFVPEKYKEIYFEYGKVVFRNIDDEGKGVKYFNGEEKSVLSFLKNKNLIVAKISKKSFVQKQPKLYKLTTLQKKMYKKHKFSPKETLKIAQNLYEKGLISYPRTDCDVLTENEHKLIPELVEFYKENNLFSTYIAKLDLDKIKMNKHHLGKLEGHYALIPNLSVKDNIANLDQIKSLDGKEKIIYSEITKSVFLACLPVATGENVKIEACCEKYKFLTEGKKYIERGFLEFCGEEKEFLQELEGISEKDELEGVFVYDSKTTTAPPLYNEGTILNLMTAAHLLVSDERLREPLKNANGIGTAATIHTFIPTLIKRGFIKFDKKNIVPTEIGLKFSEITPKKLREADFSAKLEYALSLIEQRKSEKTAKDFMGETLEFLQDVFAEVENLKVVSIFNRKRKRI